MQNIHYRYSITIIEHLDSPVKKSLATVKQIKLVRC